MSAKELFRITTAALLVLAVVPLVAFLAVGYLVPVALLAAALVLSARRVRMAAALASAGAVVVGGGIVWAAWILGALGDNAGSGPVDGVELTLDVILPLASIACLVAAVRVWRSAGQLARV